MATLILTIDNNNIITATDSADGEVVATASARYVGPLGFGRFLIGEFHPRFSGLEIVDNRIASPE